MNEALYTPVVQAVVKQRIVRLHSGSQNYRATSTPLRCHPIKQPMMQMEFYKKKVKFGKYGNMKNYTLSNFCILVPDSQEQYTDN
jgi:hypothetical protein